MKALLSHVRGETEMCLEGVGIIDHLEGENDTDFTNAETIDKHCKQTNKQILQLNKLVHVKRENITAFVALKISMLHENFAIP